MKWLWFVVFYKEITPVKYGDSGMLCNWIAHLNWLAPLNGRGAIRSTKCIEAHRRRATSQGCRLSMGVAQGHRRGDHLQG
jgi:hypothetical protein